MTVAVAVPAAGALLDPFLRPAGVALLGSGDVDALRLWGYAGAVRTGAGAGCDVALVTTGPDGVLAALEACAEAGIRHAVVLTGGTRRSELRAFLASVPSFRLIGPNCAGVMSPITGTILSTSAARLGEPATAGGAGLVLQSGGIGSGLALTLLRRGAGFAHLVTTGDELGIGAIEVAVAMVDDPACTAVGMFIEGLTDPEWLPALGQAIERTGKPVVALRSGASAGGRAAAFGHTGRVVGDGEIARAVLEHAGVRLVDTLEELSDAVTVLSVLRPRPLADETRVGVVTAAGGAGVLAADSIERTPNLRLAPLTAEARRAMAAAVGSAMPVANPYDMPSLGDPEVFRRALRAMGTHGGCDVLIAVTTTLAHDYAVLAADDYRGLPPLVIAHLSPDERFTPEQGRRLAAAGVPNVASVQHAVAAVADWAGRRGHRAAPAPSHPGRRLGVLRSAAVLGPVAAAEAVGSAHQAVAAAVRCDGAVAVKAEGSAIAHRTEAGALRTGLLADEVASAYEVVAAVCAAYGDEVVVQPMAPAGVEVFLAVVRDPELGPVALCRPGGVLVELAGTTAFLTGPPTGWPAIVEGSTVGRLLAGYRGAPPADLAGLLRLAERLVAAAAADDRITGIECNPVVVHPADRAHGVPAVTVVDLATYLKE